MFYKLALLLFLLPHLTYGLPCKDTFEEGRKYVSYEEARKYAIKNNVKNIKDWNRREHPPNIPRLVATYFKRQGKWTNWYDFLGKQKKQDIEAKERAARREAKEANKHVSYEEARKYAIANQIKNINDWRSRTHPPGIPKNPNYVYERTDDWQGWLAFLGKGVEVSYAEARQYARDNNITTSSEWRKHDHPPGIPKRPHEYFAKTYDWISWYEFLGKKKKNGSTPEFREHLHEKLDGNKVVKNSDIFILPPLGMSKRRRP